MERPVYPEPSPAAKPVAGVSVANAQVSDSDEEATAVSSKLFRCACVRRCLPLAYREEIYQVLWLTGPLLLSRILNFLLPFVITIFCGHIGNAELAGYALASVTINLTTTATGYGLAVACDTLVSQTFGGKHLKRVGVILQRSSLILLLFCLPCWGLLINSHNVLLSMHQEDEVARIAQLYVTVFLPAVPAMFLHQLQVAYLQNQGIILPQMYTAAAANIINLGVNYVLIISLKWGVMGSAIANSFSQITICLLLYGYIRWKNLHRETWGGWSTECLQEWGSFLKLAIPSAFMVCFEWWIWEIGGLLAGILGEMDLAAQHVMIELGAITYMFPLGVHAAACVRVGNALGAGDTARAIITCKVALTLSGVLAVLQGIIIAACKSIVGYIVTSDKTIVEMVSKNLTVYIFLQFFDAILCVCSGILVGSGRQKIAAMSNLVCYYCIGLPIGVALMFPAKLRLLGLWLSLLICVSIETVFFLVLIYRCNWKKVTQQAQRRAGKKIVVTPKRPVSSALYEATVPDLSNGPETLQVADEDVSKADGYSLVNTQDKELKMEKAQGSNRDAEQNTNPSKPKPEMLTITQIILRRGLAVLVSVSFLVLGIAFHFAFPAPEHSAQRSMNFSMSWANDSTPTPTPLTVLELTSHF